MWTVDHELTEWFDEVERKRDEKYGTGDSRESTPMMQNELSAGRR